MKTNTNIRGLLQEAEVLRKDFQSEGYYTWYRYSKRHTAEYASWKKNVLSLITRVRGEESRLYTDLVGTEKNYSEIMPCSVFLAFLNTLEELSGQDEAGAGRQVTGTSSERSPEPRQAGSPEPGPAAVDDAPQPFHALYAAEEGAGKGLKTEAQTEAAPRPSPPATAKPSQERQAGHRGPAAAAGPRGNTEQLRAMRLEALKTYSVLIDISRELLTPRRGFPEAGGKAAGVCSLAAKNLRADPLLLNCVTFATRDDYIYAHTVNVLILSLAMAHRLALTESDLELLSFCALFHDIGMPRFRELYAKDRQLTDREFSRLSLHVEEGISAVEELSWMEPDFKAKAQKIIGQVHERTDGKGYPSGLKADGIEPLAQIIGVADVYEALTHPRPWRKAIHPYETFRQLIEKPQKGFRPDILKALIQALSIYPPGSLAKLSQGEIARVLRTHEGAFTKPLVEVLIEADGSLADGRLADLFENPIKQSIKSPVSLADLAVKYPEFAKALEEELWWDPVKALDRLHDGPAVARGGIL